MLGQLIDVETRETMLLDTFCDQEALAAENERAQAETEGRLSWEPVSGNHSAGAASFFDLGIMTAHVLCVPRQFGENDEQK